MNIYSFKSQFEAETAPLGIETLWKYLGSWVRTNPDQEYCEEFSFSVSEAEYMDGKKIIRDDTLFQVYFGRLIDAEKNSPWNSAEINIYLRYKMAPELRVLLNELKTCEIEDAYRLSDDKGLIFRKLDQFIAFIDTQADVWTALRNHTPVLREIQFFIT